LRSEYCERAENKGLIQWRKFGLSWAVMAALLLALPILAILQYHWVGQISQAELERMQSRLQSETVKFGEDFNAAIRAAFQAIQQPGFGRDREALAEGFARWKESAAERNLVRTIYLVEGEERELYAYDSGQEDFVRIEWPERLAGVRARMEGGGPRGGSFDDGAPVIMAPRMRRGGPGPGGMFLRGPEGGRGRGEPPREFQRGGGSPRGGWPGPPPPMGGLVFAELDLGYIEQDLLPRLVKRHFAPDYDVRIVNRLNPAQLIYQSDPALTAAAFEKSEARTTIYEARPPGPGGPPTEGRWQVLIKRRSGTLEAAVNKVRYRNLAVSFGVLFLMAGSIAMLLQSTRRAQRLAGLQMDFVAGVSHELRTPLAVICSAADNLADGVVGNPAQVKRYGAVIRGEGRRLAEMVEQIMGFAGIQAGKANYRLEPVAVEDLIAKALAASESAVRDAGCEIKTEIDAGLPQVMADETPLAHSIGNLITNAAKYGRAGCWIGVRAERDDGGGVRITVRDKGPGIAAKDLPHIFEPFYRGEKAIADQVHGAGLGLSLVKRIVEAHHGSIEAVNVPEGGARFSVIVKAANGATNTAG
jgi:signal transduction histidine kinase